MIGRNMLSMSGLSLYRNAVQFGMNVGVAAFLTPADYGLIVFTTPFLVLIAMLTDLGLASAIARAPALSAEEAGAAFGTTVAGGLAGAALLAAVAWPVQRATGMAGLAPVMTAMGVTVVFSLAAATPRALLERQLRYGLIAGVEAAVIAAAAVLGVLLAWAHAGVWALVAYNGAVQAGRAAAFVAVAGRGLRPSLQARRIAPLLSFGGWVLATNLLNFLARNADNLLIGIFLGAATVGVYGLSYQFMLVPLMAITWPTSAILLASLRGHDAHGSYARAMVEGVLSATAMVSLPAMIFLVFGLDWPVRALLSARWAGVPAIVAWLAPAGALQALASYNGALLMTAGRARAQFVVTLLNTGVLLVTFAAALPFGLMTMVRAYALVVTLLSCAFLALVVALTGLGWRRLAAAVAPAAQGALSGLGAVWLATGFHLTGWRPWLEATALYGLVVVATYLAWRARIRGVATILTRPAPATGI